MRGIVTLAGPFDSSARRSGNDRSVRRLAATGRDPADLSRSDDDPSALLLHGVADDADPRLNSEA